MRWCRRRVRSWLGELPCPTNSDTPTRGREASLPGLPLLNCHGQWGRKGFKNWFQRKYGRLPTWCEAEFCRMNKGKLAAKLAIFWKKFDLPHPEELDSTMLLETFTVYTDLQEAGYSDAMALCKCSLKFCSLNFLFCFEADLVR